MCHSDWGDMMIDRGEDRVERTVLQIAELRQRPALDQHDRHRADMERADSEADRDQEKVLGQREGADHPVEAERGSKHLEVEERPGSPDCRPPKGRAPAPT